MSSFSSEVKAKKVWFDEKNMWVSLNDGRMLAIPKNWFPRLNRATEEQLKNYEFSGDGIGIHWEDLDEDISVPNLLMGYRSREAETIVHNK